MKNTGIQNGVRNAFVGVAMLVLVSGCASTPFQMTSGNHLSPEGMQHMVLRAKYVEPLATKIPEKTKAKYEATFRSLTNLNVRVVAKDSDPKPEVPYYYLNTEVTKYKPGSRVLRMLMTPVIAFGLWGSYVDVDYSICDPSTDAPLGTGVVRKSNLWGGSLGGSITSETQLESCPKAILGELDSFMKK